MTTDLKRRATETPRTVEVDRLPEMLHEILLDVGIDFHTFEIVRDGRVVAQIVPPRSRLESRHLTRLGSGRRR